MLSGLPLCRRHGVLQLGHTWVDWTREMLKWQRLRQ